MKTIGRFFVLFAILAVQAPRGAYAAGTAPCDAGASARFPFAGGDGTPGNPYGICSASQLQQMEHKARRVLFDLWDSCWRNYVEKGRRVIRILPPGVGALLDAARGRRAKARQICDWLASLTDGMIIRTYRRLFDPEFGSI